MISEYSRAVFAICFVSYQFYVINLSPHTGTTIWPIGDKIGTVQRQSRDCPALHTARQNLLQMWLEKAAVIPPLYSFVVELIASPPSHIMSFILDPSSLPQIICLYQNFGTEIHDLVFYMTRTYAYGLHRKKLILLGKWPYSTKNENCFPPLNRTTNSFVSGAPDGCPGDPLAIARGEDPLGPSSINSTVQSPTVNCSYHHSRRRSPSKSD